MSLTVRQLQRLFSSAARQKKRVGDNHTSIIGDVGGLISGNRHSGNALITPDGSLENTCDCPDCSPGGVTKICGAADRVNSWAREYGPNAKLTDVLAAEWEKRPQEDSGEQEDGENQNEQQQGQQNNGSGRSNQTQTTGPASENGSGSVPPKDQNKSKQQLEQAKQALKAAIEKLAKTGDISSLAQAKKKLKEARRKSSFNIAAERAGVSLEARQQVSNGLGRLGRVSQRLRNRMADLINRLVEQGGAAGDTLSPIPVLSPGKLVKRMVVRRPLSNALKEDSIAGRPVTLFLPDISPSCADQAQPACDIANAAGYAGVSGSDVLVMPHFNGEVSSSEEYIPWFNGKPAARTVKEAQQLFDEVCSGQSRFRVRVVVCLGDHDAVLRYENVALLRSVTRILWLHNFDTERSYPEPATKPFLPDWHPDATAKLSMVVGCVDQAKMLKGFDRALNM